MIINSFGPNAPESRRAAPLSPAAAGHRRRWRRRQPAATALTTALAVVLSMFVLTGCPWPGDNRQLTSCPAMSRSAENDQSCVSAMQNAFLTLGEDVEVDGVYGTQTEKVVRRFQATRDLTIDGIAGTSTLKALEDAQPADRTIITAHGAFTCGNPFKTCTYYFGRATTRQIYVASGQADGLRALCLRLEEIRTRVVCEVLLTLATLVVREEAGRAVAAHGCLAAALGNVRLRTDTGPHCRP